jgi:hypothetical protein
VRDAHYQFGLWDLTVRAAVGDPLSDSGNLLIPVTDINYVRPRSGRGPWLISEVAKAGPVPDGHIVFGTAMVICADCIRRRDYRLYFAQGQTGWYTEIDENENPIRDLWLVLSSGGNFESIIDRIVPPRRRRVLQ